MDWPPRILHVIDRLDGYGGARVLRRLAASKAAAGTRVTVAALAADLSTLNSLRLAGVETRVLPRRGPWDMLSLTRLGWMLARTEADIVHAWDPQVLGVATITNRRGNKAALVATLGTPPRPRAWTRPMTRRLARRVDGFAAVDGAAQAWLESIGMAQDAITFIRPGVAAPAPSVRTRASLLAELSIPADAPLIAIAGPLLRSRAIDESIWCFELVRVLYPNARMLIMGDGPDRPRLERFALQVSEPGCVRFLGFRDDVSDFMQHVDVFWQLGAATTTTPWPLLEALAAATPVVAADVPAHRAVVPPSQIDWLAPLNNRAEITRITDQILRDPAAARQKAREGAATVLASWPLESALDAYSDLYRRAVQRAAARR